MSGLVFADQRGPVARLRGRSGRTWPPARIGASTATGRLVGPVSLVAGSASLQASAAVATTVFATLGATGTSASRFLAGAVALIAIARPRVRGRGVRWWVAIGAFGASMAAANLCLFEAIARGSLGTAVTLQFLGPLTLALLAARRRLDLACAVAGLGGVVLLSGGPSGASAMAVVFGLGAGASVAISIVAGDRVARATEGLEGLALAVGAAALLTCPLGLPALAGALDLHTIATVAVLGVLGIAAPYALFLHALRHVGARTYSVLLSLDPGVAVCAGILLLGEAPALVELVGVGLVVAASATAVSTRSPTSRGERG